MLKVLTERRYNTGIARQVVYEWEEDLARELNLTFEFMDSYTNHPFARFMRKIKLLKPISWNLDKDSYIFFAMNIDLLKLITWYMPNVIPIILDITLDEIDELYKITKKLPVFWVTARNIYQIIKECYPDTKAAYIPQMVSGRYFSLAKKYEKDIWFIQYGRRNPVLHEYAMKYCSEHIGGVYVYRHIDPKKGMVIYKNNKKCDIGVVLSREEFMDYLLRSKISLCSSPMMDHTRNFGENIDFLTARWYESVACGCFVFARWSENAAAEGKMIGLDKVVNEVNEYKEFEKLADQYLNKDKQDISQMDNFCQNNMVESRARIIYKALYSNNIIK